MIFIDNPLKYHTFRTRLGDLMGNYSVVHTVHFSNTLEPVSSSTIRKEDSNARA